MPWTKLSHTLLLPLLLQGCGIYFFSGSLLPPAAHTCSLQFQSHVALGPPDLGEKFQERLGQELTQRTRLKLVEAEGDLQLEGSIQQFAYTPIGPTQGSGGSEEAQASTDRLTISVQLNYINPYEPAASLSKKTFTQHADMPAEASRGAEEPALIEKIFNKLFQDIFNATINNW